jgi:hypothetical protein
MLGYWSYATHKKIFFLDIYIYKKKKKNKYKKKNQRSYSFFFLARSSSAHVVGLNTTSIVELLVQTSDPVGYKGMHEFPHACFAWLLLK